MNALDGSGLYVCLKIFSYILSSFLEYYDEVLMRFRSREERVENFLKCENHLREMLI